MFLCLIGGKAGNALEGFDLLGLELIGFCDLLVRFLVLLVELFFIALHFVGFLIEVFLFLLETAL